MKKLVNTPLSNTIWWATVNENNGTMNTSTRVDVTDNAIDVVISHIVGIKEYKERGGYAGYIFPKTKGGTMTLCVIDNDKYKIIKREDDNIEAD